MMLRVYTVLGTTSRRRIRSLYEISCSIDALWFFGAYLCTKGGCCLPDGVDSGTATGTKAQGVSRCPGGVVGVDEAGSDGGMEHEATERSPWDAAAESDARHGASPLCTQSMGMVAVHESLSTEQHADTYQFDELRGVHVKLKSRAKKSNLKRARMAGSKSGTFKLYERGAKRSRKAATATRAHSSSH